MAVTWRLHRTHFAAVIFVNCARRSCCTNPNPNPNPNPSHLRRPREEEVAALTLTLTLTLIPCFSVIFVNRAKKKLLQTLASRKPPALAPSSSEEEGEPSCSERVLEVLSYPVRPGIFQPPAFSPVKPEEEGAPLLRARP